MILSLWLLICLPRSEAVETLKSKMQEMNAVLIHLLDDFRRPLPEPGTLLHRRIDLRLQRLTKLSHQVKPLIPATPEGQILPILGQPLPEEAARMRAAWEVGQGSYARSIFRTLIASCMECHAAGRPKGPVVPSPSEKDFAGLVHLDQGRYWKVLGYPDQAFQEFLSEIRLEPLPPSGIFNYEEGLQELLSMEIRSQRPSRRLLDVLKSQLERESIPRYLRAEIKTWIRDLERPDFNRNGRVLTPHEKLRLAIRWIRKGRSLQETPLDTTPSVWFWNAITLLHEALQKIEAAPTRAEILFQLATAYEILRPRVQETLHERLYEACIRGVPHTPRSDSCYRRLERSVIAGFTGSSGTHLPEEERKRLLELWGLAFLSQGMELR
jgi:hypothetical protein